MKLADSDPSYSLVAPYVYIGDKRMAKDKELMQTLGITHIVNVTKDIRNYFDIPPFKYLKCPCDDTDVAMLNDHFDKAADFIAEGVSEGHAVLVHCQQGVSRSTSIVLAYLIKKQNLTLKEAYTKVRAARPEAKPKQNFLSQLIAFEQKIARNAVSTKKRKNETDTNGTQKSIKVNETKGATRTVGPTMPPTKLPGPSLPVRNVGPSLPPSVIQEKKVPVQIRSATSRCVTSTTVDIVTRPGTTAVDSFSTGITSSFSCSSTSSTSALGSDSSSCS